MPICEQCRHFHVLPRIAPPPGDRLLGECRRFPPAAPPTVISVGSESTPLAMFPLLRAGEWCGEFSEATSRAVVASSPFMREKSQPISEDKRLLVSAREAAKMLGLSTRTLYTMTARGELKPVRVGRRVCYSPEALRAWIAARQ